MIDCQYRLFTWKKAKKRRTERFSVIALTFKRYKLPAHRGEALAAIDGAVVLGNERNGGLGAAIRTRGGVGLAGSAGSRTAGLARLTASLAAGGLVLEALLSVEFLFASGEHEFLPTVAAYQRLVFVHRWKPPDNDMRFKIWLTWFLTPHSPAGALLIAIIGPHSALSDIRPAGLTSKPHRAH